MATENILEDENFQLLAFLLASARGCLDEPPIYGSLRLIDAAEKTINIIIRKLGEIQELSEIRKKIEKARSLVLADEEEFSKTLDEIMIDISKMIQKA
ncbi:MAG: DUF6092 family protein [Nitrososphaerota archaeon]